MPDKLTEFLVLLSFWFGPTLIVAYFVTTVLMIMNRKPGVKLIYLLLWGPYSWTQECLTERGMMWRNVSIGLFCIGFFYMYTYTEMGK